MPRVRVPKRIAGRNRPAGLSPDDIDVRLRLEYADGTSQTRRIPVEAWHTSGTFTATVLGPEVRAATVDPEHRLPDVDRGNDGWSAAADDGPSR